MGFEVVDFVPTARRRYDRENPRNGGKLGRLPKFIPQTTQEGTGTRLSFLYAQNYIYDADQGLTEASSNAVCRLTAAKTLLRRAAICGYRDCHAF